MVALVRQQGAPVAAAAARAPAAQIDAKAVAHIAKLKRELIEMGYALQQSGLRDTLTQDLVQWHANFLKAFHSKARDQAIGLFTEQLKKILTNPIGYGPLDEDAVLGSDGRTYSKAFLRHFRCSTEEPYRSRSPLDPHNAVPFRTQPHPVVRHLVQWLKKHGQYIAPAEEEKKGDELVEEKKEPPVAKGPDARRAHVPVVREEKKGPSIVDDPDGLRRVIAAQAIQGPIVDDETLELDQLLQEECNIFEDNLNEQVGLLRQETRENVRVVHARLDELERLDEEALAPLRQKAAALQAGAADLERGNVELAEETRRIGVQGDETERDNKRLQILINETKIAQAKRESSGWSDLAGALLTIGACALASWSFGVSIAPMKNGLKVIIPI